MPGRHRASCLVSPSRRPSADLKEDIGVHGFFLWFGLLTVLLDAVPAEDHPIACFPATDRIERTARFATNILDPVVLDCGLQLFPRTPSVAVKPKHLFFKA